MDREFEKEAFGEVIIDRELSFEEELSNEKYKENNVWKDYSTKDNIIKKICKEEKDITKSCNSLVSITSYTMLYNWLKKSEIRMTHIENSYKIQTEKENIYEGFTLLPVWTYFKKYVDLLAQDLLKKENLTSEEKVYLKIFEAGEFGKYKGYKWVNTYSYYINEIGDMSIDTIKNSKISIYKNLFKIIKNEVEETTQEELKDKTFYDIMNTVFEQDGNRGKKMKEFLYNCSKIGNYMIAPQWFFMVARNSIGQYSLNTLLTNIYQYFETINSTKQLDEQQMKAIQYLDNLFNTQSITNFLQWINEANINNWNEFVEQNCLQPFVDVDNEVNFEPQNLEELELFITEINNKINDRNLLICEKIKKK